jgi:hypothetical protein
VDRLSKRGLPHPSHCPLCDQEDETVQHLLTTCVLAREFWSRILTPLVLQDRSPTRRENHWLIGGEKQPTEFQRKWRRGLTQLSF